MMPHTNRTERSPGGKKYCGSMVRGAGKRDSFLLPVESAYCIDSRERLKESMSLPKPIVNG